MYIFELKKQINISIAHIIKLLLNRILKFMSYLFYAVKYYFKIMYIDIVVCF